jgi:RNA polymerase sigma factor (sigma-70 family)
MTGETELLRRYAAQGDEGAFTELVRSRVDFVYAAALRQVHGNAALAQDATQAVFTDLARKAAALSRHEVLVGWLHTATRFAAARVLRAESRRRAREHEAHAMNENLSEPGASIDWRRVQPILDEVLGVLKERERLAILLRFFEHRPFAEVGARLALTETAARSCVDRALDKMRVLLKRRGVTSTSTALGVALANQAAIAAPAGLATAVAGTALASATGSGAAVALGTIFTMGKIKTGMAAIVIIAAATVAVREAHAIRLTEERIKAAQAQQQGVAVLRTENETLAATVARVAQADPSAAELARLSQRIAQLKARPEGVVDALMKPLSEYRYAGRDSALAAMETQLWARAVGNAEAFGPLLGFTDRGKAKLNAFFASLPEEVRARHGTPEKMLAPIASSWGPLGSPEAIQILGQTEYGPKVMVQAWARYASGEERKMDLLFQLYEEGWRVPHPDEMVDGIIASLDPVTGERRSAGK